MDIPFIQLFRSPNSFYFLDVNNNEIVSITEASFHYLSSIINHDEEQIHPITPEIETLKSLGYLATESAVKQVRHVYSDYLHFFLERKLSKITLQVTQNCNFRCKYCVYSEDSNVHQRNHSSAHMTWSTAKKAINFLWEHSVDSQDVNVGFYGGEPLLEFPLIQKIVEYSLFRFRGKKISFTITSNGSLLNDDIIQYFYKHDISLVISLDGPRVIHDQNRVFSNGRGTFDTIIENLNRVKEIAPEYGKKISISMVMDPINDFDCINSICISGLSTVSRTDFIRYGIS